MEHEGASTSSKPSKIELHSHIKVDLNGRQLALELHKPLQEIERADNHRK
jgi:hypothetical protein